MDNSRDWFASELPIPGLTLLGGAGILKIQLNRRTIMIKIIILTVFLYACYALYQRLKYQLESRQGGSASNKREGIDPSQAIDAEYKVIEDGQKDGENG